MKSPAPQASAGLAIDVSGEQEKRADLLDCWCGNGDWNAVFRGRRAGLARCAACGCCQTDPPPLHSSSESADFYTGYYEDVGTDAEPIKAPDVSRSSSFWRVVECVPELRDVGECCVDIGCGDGHLCAELEAMGWRSVIGFDISRSRVLRARRMYPHLRLFDGSIHDSDIAKGSVDLMTMDAVIEHLPDPVEELRSLRRYLAPGGRIVLTTPNMDSGHFRFLGERWSGMLAPHAHIFLFDAPSISLLLQSAGFAVEAVGSYHSPLYSPKDYVRRLLRGDLKGLVWRAHQEIGAVYGRLIASGPMLYAVGRQE